MLSSRTNLAAIAVIVVSIFTLSSCASSATDDDNPLAFTARIVEHVPADASAADGALVAFDALLDGTPALTALTASVGAATGVGVEAWVLDDGERVIAASDVWTAADGRDELAVVTLARRADGRDIAFVTHTVDAASQTYLVENGDLSPLALPATDHARADTNGCLGDDGTLCPIPHREYGWSLCMDHQDGLTSYCASPESKCGGCKATQRLMSATGTCVLVGAAVGTIAAVMGGFSGGPLVGWITRWALGVVGSLCGAIFAADDPADKCNVIARKKGEFDWCQAATPQTCSYSYQSLEDAPSSQYTAHERCIRMGQCLRDVAVERRCEIHAGNFCHAVNPSWTHWTTCQAIYERVCARLPSDPTTPRVWLEEQCTEVIEG